MNKINGLPPPTMSRDTEEILRRMLRKYKFHLQFVQKGERTSNHIHMYHINCSTIRF